MKILVVHEVSYRKKVVYEYQDFAERLASLGHEVTVIDYDESGDHAYRKERISRTGVAEVTLENTPYTNLPILKYLTGRRNYARLLKAKLARGEVDVVLLYSVFINGTSTVRLCRRFGVPVVYRVLDVYHKIRQSRLVEWPLYFGEKYIYRHADFVSATTSKLALYARALAGKDSRTPIETLDHGVDTSHFRPGDRLAVRARYGMSPETTVLFYLGTTYDFSGLDGLVPHLPSLGERFGDVRLMVVGGGPLDEKLKLLAEDPKYKGRLVLTGFRNYDELPPLLAAADVCLNPFGRNAITEDIVPIKILQYLACGKATVSSPLREVKRLFPEGESGVLYGEVEPMSSYVSRVAELIENADLRRKLGENGLRFVSERFSVDQQVRRLEATLRSVRARPTTAREPAWEPVN